MDEMKTAMGFVIWLKGFLDGHAPGAPLAAWQDTKIREELHGVFLHEIDPSMGNEVHQSHLDVIHNGPPFTAEDFRMKC